LLTKAWLSVLRRSHNEMLYAIYERSNVKDNWILGLKIDDDLPALKYQYAAYRYTRALYALDGINPVINAKKLTIGGWEDITDENNKRMIDNNRAMGLRAKKILRRKR